MVNLLSGIDDGVPIMKLAEDLLSPGGLFLGDAAYLLLSLFVAAVSLHDVGELETMGVGRTVWKSLIGVTEESDSCLPAAVIKKNGDQLMVGGNSVLKFYIALATYFSMETAGIPFRLSWPH